MARTSNAPAAIQASKEISREIITIIGTVLLLELVGLIAAIALAWALSSAFGQDLSKYPWHAVLFIDLAFILFSAALAEFAEGPAQRSAGSEPDARTWILASFIIAVGTLAPLASHAGKIWRDLSDRPGASPQESTILSEILCAPSSSGCSERYFAIIFGLTVACCVLALLTAFLLREIASGRERANSGPASYATFGVSVFLFAVYTMLNQKWDVPGVKLAAISPAQLLWIIVSIFFLVAALAIASGRIVFRTRNIRLSIRRYRTTVSEPNRLFRKLTLLLIAMVAIAISIAALGLAATLITILVGALPDWVRSVAVVDQLLRFLTNFLYLTLGLIAISAALVLIATLITIVRWMWPRHQAETVKNGDRVRNDAEGRVRRDELPERSDQTGGDRGGFKSVGPAVTECLQRCWNGLIGAVLGLLQGGWKVLKLMGRIVLLLLRGGWKGLVLVGRFLWDPPRAGVAISMVLLTCSMAFALSVVRWPHGEGGGKMPLEPSVGGLAKAGLPPLTISRASIVCPSDDPPAWAHGEVKRLQTTSWSRSCSFEREISVPCWAASIIVVGTASGPGDIQAEKQRARDRGRNLALILKQRILQRCKDAANVRSYVLNLGRYAEGPFSSDAVTQREVYVLVGGGETTDMEVATAVEMFAASEPRFAQYSACDFYWLDPADEPILVRNLKCGSRGPGR